MSPETLAGEPLSTSPDVEDDIEDAVSIEARLGAGFFRPRPITFVRGAGALLFDADGAEYIDCSASYGVASLGHAHPAVTAAIADQAARLVALTPSFANDRRAAYLTELAAVLPAGLERVFLCNSGTESIEAALKIARLATGRSEVVACVRGFHGRTLGALSATHERRYKEPFEPLVPGFTHVPPTRPDALREAVTERTAAVVLEVVQGEGGVRPVPEDFLREAQELCHARGALLVVDEVQTGFARTGTLFACERVGLEPDLLCLAKGIASGFPMGATSIGARVGELPQGAHGSTFGGNPLACAAASATLGVIVVERLAERAEELGTWLVERLEALGSPRVREVRGRGLMVGIELKEHAAPFLAALLERRVIALAAGPNVIRLLPPLVIERAELERATLALAEVLA